MARRGQAQRDSASIGGAGGPPADQLARAVGRGAAQSTKWIYDATIPRGMAGDEGPDAFARATPKNLKSGTDHV